MIEFLLFAIYKNKRDLASPYFFLHGNVFFRSTFGKVLHENIRQAI